MGGWSMYQDIPIRSQEKGYRVDIVECSTGSYLILVYTSCCCCWPAAGCCWRTPAKHLPAVKQHGPKGRTDAKIYVFRSRNVPSEILQKYHFSTLFPPCYKLSKAAGCWLAASCCTAAAALTAAAGERLQNTSR